MKFLLYAVALFILITGCASCSQETKGLREEVKLLKEENSFLKAENAGLKKEIEELYKKIEEKTAIKENIKAK
ncbi:MAG: hypothetical protein NTU90_04505, partial [Proteobacteria bacterium]|nr:hypothetical protein [Pseudomonadota bacterium]